LSHAGAAAARAVATAAQYFKAQAHYEEVEELGAGLGAGAGVTSVVSEDAAPLNVAA